MTKLEVFNNAFIELGEATVANLDVSQPRVEAANAVWGRTLRMFLRELPWPWARKLAELEPESPAPAFRWSYRYELPSDFISLTRLNEVDVLTPSSWWEIIGAELHTNTEEAQIEYVYCPSETDTDTFLTQADPKALDSLVLLLASKIAPKVCRDERNSAIRLLQQYQVALGDARCRAANQRKKVIRDSATESAFDWARIGDQQG